MDRSRIHHDAKRAPAATVLALLAVVSPGCISSYRGPEGDGIPRFHQALASESGMDLSSVPAAPPARGGSFWTDFASEAGRVTRDLGRRSASNPLILGAAVETQPGFEAVVAGGDLMAGEDALRSLSRDGRTEMMRILRKALNGALRKQELYHDVREVLQVALGGDPITRVEPGPVLEDPAVDDSYGASRLFSGSPSSDWFRSPSADDVDAIVNLGMHPRLGVRWMRLYRFSYEPRAREMVHRLEYGVGALGVGAAYRVRDGAATDVGVGLQLPVGAMSSVTLSAGRMLRGAGIPEDGTSGGRSVMAELVCRF